MALVVLGAVGSLIVFVIRAEYRYWGDIAAKLLIHLGTLFLSAGAKETRRCEWLAELDSIQDRQDHAGLLFGVQMFLAGMRLTAYEGVATCRQCLEAVTLIPRKTKIRITAVVVIWAWGAVATANINGAEAWLRFFAVVAAAAETVILLALCFTQWFPTPEAAAGEEENDNIIRP